MARERYVLLGVAPARASWFTDVGRWSTSAAIPAEFVRCVSVPELRARLASGRRFSAVLVDGQLSGVDRDVLATADELGCPVVVVDARGREPWADLSPAAVLTPPFSREQLLETLEANAEMIGTAVDATPSRRPEQAAVSGELVSVLGPGGTGASTAAITLAQGLATGASGASVTGGVLLADLCRTADQAMLHDSRVVVPGIQELVDAHRSGSVPASTIVDQTFDVSERGYRLLLGLRRPRQWTSIRPRAFDAALDGLQRTFGITVCDLDPDLEGEAETGSVDVEERHLMARTAVARSSATFVVGSPDMKGLFSLVRLMGEVLAFGTPSGRIVPVLSRAPRNPRQRAELTTALRSLVAANIGASATILNPVMLPERRVDDALRDAVAMPKPMPSILAGAYHAVRARSNEPVDPAAGVPTPQRIAPGAVPRFADQEPTTRG